MKYIVVKGQFGDESAILFDELLTHKDVAQTQQVISAGFVRVKGVVDRLGTEYLETCCYGESTSLDKKSRGEVDTRIVTRALVNHF